MKNWYYSVAIHEIGEILAPYFVYIIYTGCFSLLPRNYPLLAHMVVGFWNTFSTFFVSLGQDLVSTTTIIHRSGGQTLLNFPLLWQQHLRSISQHQR